MSDKKLYKNNWIQKDSKLAKNLSILNKANLVGILYSCIALGIVVPLVNKHMTESKRKKKALNVQPEQQLQKLEMNNVKQQKTQKIITNFLLAHNVSSEN